MNFFFKMQNWYAIRVITKTVTKCNLINTAIFWDRHFRYKKVRINNWAIIRTPVTLSWNTFLAKIQFTLLLSFQSNWTFWRRKIYRIVIYHVNGCFIQCLCTKIFTIKKTFQLRHNVPNLKHFYLLCLIWNIS